MQAIFPEDRFAVQVIFTKASALGIFVGVDFTGFHEAEPRG